jgi:hypothetical protein
MKKHLYLIVVLCLILHTNILAQRGSIVFVNPLATVSPEQIMQNLQLKLDETSYALVNLFTYKKYSVNALKVIYRTIDGRGNPTTASGVVFLPAVSETTYMPVFSYLHGTLTRDLDAPSNLQGIETIIGWIMAMDGYISVLPDYLGMGDGPGIHPYQHADSEASASVDMLKAAMLLCNSYSTIKSKPDGKLYLSGYSQGAHAALATQNELQMNPVPGLSLRKTVAGSGAYSLSYVQKNFVFEQNNYSSPSFLPYLLLGYQEVYRNLYSNLNQVYINPYNTTIPGLFNGLFTTDEINSQLPAAWKSIFAPAFLWNIQNNYFHPVNAALRKNDVINWKPKSDLHLYYCTCDELVDNNNSLLAYLSFVMKGSTSVSCAPVGPFKHAECAPFVLLLSKIKFDCDSHANPCGIDILSLLKSATKEDLSVFSRALLAPDQFPDKDELLKNKLLAAYFQLQPEKTDNIRVYPNPALDVVYIDRPADSQAIAKIRLFDMQGRLVIDRIFEGNLIQIDVKHLPAGVYKIVMNGDNSITKSLVVFK